MQSAPPRACCRRRTRGCSGPPGRRCSGAARRLHAAEREVSKRAAVQQAAMPCQLSGSPHVVAATREGHDGTALAALDSAGRDSSVCASCLATQARVGSYPKVRCQRPPFPHTKHSAARPPVLPPLTVQRYIDDSTTHPAGAGPTPHTRAFDDCVVCLRVCPLRLRPSCKACRCWRRCQEAACSTRLLQACCFNVQGAACRCVAATAAFSLHPSHM